MPGYSNPRTAILITLFPTVGILLLNGWWNEPLYRASPAAFWVADVFTHVVMPAALLLALARRHGIGPEDYGLVRPPGGAADLAVLTVFATALFWLSYKPVAGFFGHVLMPESASLGYVDVMPAGPAARAAVAVYFSASAGLFEEIMYRGLPYLYCRMVLPPSSLTGGYIAGSALLFGLAHWENGVHELIGTTCLGVVACILYAKIRLLWPLVMAHFIVDMVSFS